MTSDLDAWRPVASAIAAARLRQRPRLSKRGAAKAANISEAHWRAIEAGHRIVSGVALPPAVSHQALEDAARSVGLDPAPLFAALGWEFDPATSAAPPADELALLRAEVERLARVVRDAGLDTSGDDPR